MNLYRLPKSKGFASGFLLLVVFSMLITGVIGYYIASCLDRKYQIATLKITQEQLNSSLDLQNNRNLIQDQDIADLLYKTNLTNQSQNAAISSLTEGQNQTNQDLWSFHTDGNAIKLSGTEYKLTLNGTTLSQDSSGLKLSDTFAGTLLTQRLVTIFC